jgi:Flp pilus assembly protein TadD
VLIFAAALAAFHNSFQGPFVFDDPLAIADNPTIRRLWPIGPVLLPPVDGSAVDRRPTANLSVALNYALGGTNVWDYHVFNFAAHLLAALALFAVLRRTLEMPRLLGRFAAQAVPLALIVTLLWTVHPLQTNAVTYVIQRTEVLAGLFYLLTLYCVIRGAEQGSGFGVQGSGNRGQGTEIRSLSPVPCPLSPILWYTAAVASCLLAMGSKESAVSAPVVVLVYDRVFLARSWREVWSRRWGLYVALAATWSVTAAMVGRAWMQGGLAPLPVAGQRFRPWLEYALLQPESIVLYLRLCFWPWPLILDYGPGHVGSLAGVLPYAAVVGVLAGLTIAGLRYRPACGLLGLWFFAILAPSSSVVPITPECAAEKRMYLPLAAVAVGVVLCVYAGGQRLWAGRGGRGGRVLGYGLAALVVAALAVVSVRRNEDYRTELAIYQDTVDKRPGNARAHYNLGTVMALAGRLSAAIDHYHRALRINPEYIDAHNNLGNALLQSGKTSEAIGQYRQAVRLDPDYFDAYNNLGNALALSGRLSEAMDCYQRALQLRADYPEALNNLGAVLLRSGRLSEAIVCYQQALQLKPDYGNARKNLAWVLATGRPEDGGDPAKAVSLAEQAWTLPDNDPPVSLDVLAAAYASAGRYPEAVRAAERAAALASMAGRIPLARRIEARLKLYRKGQPYRESFGTGGSFGG